MLCAAHRPPFVTHPTSTLYSTQATNLLANAVVRSNSIIMGCGVISCTGSTAFGNGTALPLGLDGAGRSTRCFAEISVALAAEVACNRDKASAAMQAAYNAAIDDYVKAATSTRSIIGRGCCITNCPRVSSLAIRCASSKHSLYFFLCLCRSPSWWMSSSVTERACGTRSCSVSLSSLCQT